MVIVEVGGLALGGIEFGESAQSGNGGGPLMLQVSAIIPENPFRAAKVNMSVTEPPGWAARLVEAAEMEKSGGGFTVTVTDAKPWPKVGWSAVMPAPLIRVPTLAGFITMVKVI